MNALQSILFDVGIKEPTLGLEGHRVLTKIGEKKYSANLGLLETIITSKFCGNILPLQKFLETCKGYQSFDSPSLEVRFHKNNMPLQLDVSPFSFIGPPSYGGSYKITAVCLSICLTVRPSLRHFQRERLISFFLTFGAIVNNWNV